MKKKVRIGIVGCGTIGNVHATAYEKIPDAELVAMCDIIPERAKEKSELHHAKKFYTDYKKMIADPSIDAIDVCVPNHLHAPVAIAAFKGGKHVMLEKPMTLNQKLAKDIIKARDAAGKKLQLGMVWRQKNEAQTIKKLIDSGRLGEIYQIRVKLIRRRGIPGLGGWFTTKAMSGGGGLIDIAVHFFDLAMWECNNWKPTRVSAKCYSKFGNPMKDYHYISMWAGPPKYDGVFDVDDYAAGFVRFGSKLTMSFEVAWACNADQESHIEFLGTKGGIKVGEGNNVLLTELDGTLADVKLNYNLVNDAFVTELEKFVAAVQGKGEVPATGEQGLIAMKLLDAIYKSSDEDMEVKI